MRLVHGIAVCETLEEVLNPEWSAVLAIDIQNDAFRPDGKLAKAGNDITQMRAILPRCANFIADARRLMVPIVHIRVTDLSGGRSDSAAWIRSKSKMSS